MNDIVMPKLSDTMTEGRLVSWKKRVGEPIRRGDVLAEVETDKANMELEAFTSGVLLEIRVEAGEVAQVGTVIAVVGAAGEKAAASAAQPGAAAQEEAPAGARQPGAPTTRQPPEAAAQQQAAVTSAETPAATSATQEPDTTKVKPEEVAGVTPKAEPAAVATVPGAQPESVPQPALQATGEPTTPPTGAATEAPAAPPEPSVAATSPGGETGVGGQATAAATPAAHAERAAPVVRRRARELGIDLSQVKGSGPEGRIVLQDLAGGQAQSPKPAPEEMAPVGAGAPATERPAAEGKAAMEKGTQPLSRLRSAVARAVSDSWAKIPHFTVTFEVVMDEAEAIRRQLKEIGFPVTLNDLVVKGVALALEKYPRMNASFAEGAITFHADINVGVAVGVPDGVLIPVIPGCHRLSLLEIATAGRRLVERAREGALNEQELTGGTFSVSNLGMYGVNQFTAIIYPSQAAVLAVGAVGDAIVARAGVPACARLMKVTLSADHRIVDGAYAAEFLAELKAILEKPVRLLI